MILTDSQILPEMARGTLVINPCDPKHLGSNSCDVHIGHWTCLDITGDVPTPCGSKSTAKHTVCGDRPVKSIMGKNFQNPPESGKP